VRRIYKYPLIVTDGDGTIELPKNYRLLKVSTQDGMHLTMWALVDPDAEDFEVFVYRIVGTGHDFEDYDEYKYFDTVQMPTGLVWHVFGKPRDR